MNRTGFQNFVNAQPAPGVAGDFAGQNPRASVAAPADGFVAPTEGTYVGRFAWGEPLSRIMSNYFQENAVMGFIHRENQALITEWLGVDSMLIVPGNNVVAMNQGDYWALFTAGADVGDAVFADAVTGLATAGGSATESIGFTGAISTAAVLTVSGDGTPATSIAVGMLVTGASVPAGTYITSLGTGVGGTGTYNLNQAPDVAITAELMNARGLVATQFTVASAVQADASITASIDAEGIMTVSAIGSGSLEPGQFITGTDIGPFAYIVSQLSGTAGDTGTYQTTSYNVAASATVVASQGKLGKISTWA